MRDLQKNHRRGEELIMFKDYTCFGSDVFDYLEANELENLYFQAIHQGDCEDSINAVVKALQPIELDRILLIRVCRESGAWGIEELKELEYSELLAKALFCSIDTDINRR